jgi:hypothetical protein
MMLLAGCRGAAADDWLYPRAAGEARSPPVDFEPPARWPPVGLVSYDAATREPPSETDPPFIGYDRGFVIADQGTERVSPDDYPFLLRVTGWSQLRQAMFASDGPHPDRDIFSLERVRLGLGGHLYSPDLQYSLVFDGNTDQSVQVFVLDSFVSYDLGHHLFDWEAQTLAIRGGKWKVPFSRSREESARQLQFSERSVANYFFDIGRSVGVGLDDETDALGNPLRFETAIFNGFNTGRDSTVPEEALNRNLAWSARSSTDLFSEFGNDGEPDLSWHSAPALRLGGGMAVTRVESDPPTEFDRQRVVASGERLSSLLPPTVTAYDILFATLDAHWKYRGLSVIVEHHWRYLSQFSGANVPNLLDQGLLLQTGYFVVPRRLEVLARWSRVAGNSGTLGLAEQNTNEVGAGCAWYIRGHNVKFNADVSWISGVPVSSDRLNLLPGDVGWLLRTQFQFGF